MNPNVTGEGEAGKGCSDGALVPLPPALHPLALSEKSLFVEGPSWQRVADAPSEGGGRAGGKNKRAFRHKIKG